MISTEPPVSTNIRRIMAVANLSCTTNGSLGRAFNGCMSSGSKVTVGPTNDFNSLAAITVDPTSIHFFNINAPSNRCHDYCVLIGVIMFFRLGIALVLISSLFLLQKTIELPSIGHLMKGFLQLPTLRCCVAEIPMVHTIFVLVLNVCRTFNGLRSSEHWTSLDFHKDIGRACANKPTPSPHFALGACLAGHHGLPPTSSCSPDAEACPLHISPWLG